MRAEVVASAAGIAGIVASPRSKWGTPASSVAIGIAPNLIAAACGVIGDIGTAVLVGVGGALVVGEE
jgi:hypothetical protein